MGVQVGYRIASRENKLTKPELGHLKKHDAPALRTLREFKVRGTHRALQPPPTGGSHSRLGTSASSSAKRQWQLRTSQCPCMSSCPVLIGRHSC